MFCIKYNLNSCVEDHRLILYYIFISTETSMHAKNIVNELIFLAVNILIELLLSRKISIKKCFCKTLSRF